MVKYRDDQQVPQLYQFLAEVPLEELTYTLNKRFVYRFYFEFICDVGGVEETLTTTLVLGDRSNKLKGLVKFIKEMMYRFDMRYIERKKTNAWYSN
ncbi:hypothetical protein ACEQPO_26545 [Bacillus sp. SL00103]